MLFNVVALALVVNLLTIVSSQTTYSCSSSAPCGCSANSATLARIVGGESASSQTWGWAASLRYTSSNSHFCGGSIISASHILTAAHCTTSLQSSPGSVRVYVGSTSLYITGQVRSVAIIYVHPSYSSSTYLNDISILKLSSPLDLTQAGVNLICLPNVTDAVLASGEYPVANINLVAIGWGVLYSGSTTVSVYLQQVTVQSVAATSTYCNNVGLRNSALQFCAGVMPGGLKDTCQGDSGGPLMLFTNSVWQIVGITSNGYGCALPNYPGIYTRVAAYQTWINDTMNSAETMFDNSRSSTLVVSFVLSTLLRLI